MGNIGASISNLEPAASRGSLVQGLVRLVEEHAHLGSLCRRHHHWGEVRRAAANELDLAVESGQATVHRSVPEPAVGVEETHDAYDEAHDLTDLKGDVEVIVAETALLHLVHETARARDTGVAAPEMFVPDIITAPRDLHEMLHARTFRMVGDSATRGPQGG